MSVDITIVNEVLKLDYIEVVRDVLNSSTVLNHRLEKDFESVQGERVYIALNKSRNISFQARATSGKGHSTDGAELPTAGEQGFAATHFPIKEMYGRLKIREKDIKASRNSKGALIRVLDTEMRHLIRDSKNTLNKYNFWDGTGIWATKESDDTGGGPNVLTLYGQGEGTTAGTYDGLYNVGYAAADYFEVDQIIGLYTGKTAAGRDASFSNVAITAVNKATPSITVAEDFDLSVDDDHVALDLTVPYAQMGLMGIVDDGDSTYGMVDDYNDITRSTAGNEYWQGNIMRNTGVLRDITLDMLQQAIDTAEVEGDGEITCFLTTYGIRREILGLLVADKRFVAPYEMDLDGGFRALSYNGIPIIPDRHAPKYIIFGLDEPSIRFYQMSDFEWMEEDGAVLSRVPNLPQYEATLFLFREMASTDPRNNVRIDDINDPT